MTKETRKGKILLIDDSRSVLQSLDLLLSDHFEKVESIHNPKLIPSILVRNDFDVVLLDMNFRAGDNSGNEGMFWLHEILKYDQTISVVMLTAYGSIDLAIKAIKKGAVDFVVKPWDNKRLLSTLSSAMRLRESAIELKNTRSRLKQINQAPFLDTRFYRCMSEAMQNLYKQVEKIAETDVNVLILGESGTGKEILAQEIHLLSGRKDEAFMAVDLGVIGESVFESELFGHKKGAFTDARDDRMGRVQVASGGTLFLDEIGNIPHGLQVKLLTLLQNRLITPVGSDRPVLVDIRLICATNNDLEIMIEEGKFREDLYYRINTIQFVMPPLRERPEDIRGFATFFLQHYVEKYGKEGLKLAPDTLEAMLEYAWPGNVRELKHAIERAVLLSESGLLMPADILMMKKRPYSMNTEKPTLENAERDTIKTALTHNKGNISHTARELHITRQTLYAKIQKYGL